MNEASVCHGALRVSDVGLFPVLDQDATSDKRGVDSISVRLTDRSRVPASILPSPRPPSLRSWKGRDPLSKVWVVSVKSGGRHVDRRPLFFLFGQSAARPRRQALALVALALEVVVACSHFAPPTRAPWSSRLADRSARTGHTGSSKGSQQRPVQSLRSESFEAAVDACCISEARFRRHFFSKGGYVPGSTRRNGGSGCRSANPATLGGFLGPGPSLLPRS